MRSTSTYLFLMNICFLAAFLMMLMSDTMAGNIFAILSLSSAVIFMITASLIFFLPDPELSASRVSKRKRLSV